ncbi:MAG: hypothetical protein V7744_07085 [Pseudomonadales bacterium]
MKLSNWILLSGFLCSVLATNVQSATDYNSSRSNRTTSVAVDDQTQEITEKEAKKARKKERKAAMHSCMDGGETKAVCKENLGKQHKQGKQGKQGSNAVPNGLDDDCNDTEDNISRCGGKGQHGKKSQGRYLDVDDDGDSILTEEVKPK